MINKLIVYQIIVFLCSTLLYGEESQRVWIYFVDKGNYQNKNIEEISKLHLSQRAISRRMEKSTAVKYDFSDLPVNQNYIDELKKNSISIIHKSKWFNAVSAYIDVSQYKELIHLHYIKKIEPVRSFKFKLNDNIEESNFYKVSDQDYGLSANQNQMLGIPAFHSRGYTGNGLLIALFDTGFRLDHDAFQSVSVLASWDFVENDNDVSGTYGFSRKFNRSCIWC